MNPLLLIKKEAERPQSMKLLTCSFSESQTLASASVWHGEVLALRLAKVEAGKGKFLALSELKARLASK